MDTLLTSKFIADNDQQQAAYDSKADEIYFGGKAGTGKSWVLLALATFEHTNSVIFRREFAQHRGGDGMIAKSKEMIFDNGRFNESLGMWTQVFGKGTIEFAGLEDDKAVNKHKGRARDFYGFDEITEFTREQYEIVTAWNRTAIQGQRCRIVCTGNPPTSPEGEWVIGYWGPWLDESHPFYPYPSGELVWFARVDGQEVYSTEYREWTSNEGRTVKPRSRTFIPGEMVSHYQNTGYAQVLENLREPLRSKLLLGDFSARVKDDLWQVIPTAYIDAAMARWTDQKPDYPLTAIGCDVSRGGVDRTVIAKRYGSWFAPLIKLDGKDAVDGGSVAAAIIRNMEVPCPVNIDVIGVGSSPYDVLRDNGAEVNAIDVRQGSSRKDRSGKYKMRNKRAEIVWMFSEALDPDKGDDIALPPDNQMKQDLAAMRFKLSTQGIQIEDKEEIKKRLGRSPDSGESVLLCWNSGIEKFDLRGLIKSAEEKTQYSKQSTMGMEF